MFQRFEETTKFRNADEAMEAMKYANELMSQAITYLTNTGVSMPSMKASPKPIEISMKNADTTATHLFNGFSNNDKQYDDATKRQNIKKVNDRYVMAMRYSFDHLLQEKMRGPMIGLLPTAIVSSTVGKAMIAVSSSRLMVTPQSFTSPAILSTRS